MTETENYSPQWNYMVDYLSGQLAPREDLTDSDLHSDKALTDAAVMYAGVFLLPRSLILSTKQYKSRQPVDLSV